MITIDKPPHPSSPSGNGVSHRRSGLVSQALELRTRSSEIPADGLGPGLRSLFDQVRTFTAFVEEDRPLEDELRAFLAALNRGEITCEWPPRGRS